MLSTENSLPHSVNQEIQFNRYGEIPETIQKLTRQQNRTRRKVQRIRHQDEKTKEGHLEELDLLISGISQEILHSNQVYSLFRHTLKNETKRQKHQEALSNLILKCFTQKYVVLLTNIINAMVWLKYFPNHWKNIDVIPSVKPNMVGLFPQNYRPISLLTAIIRWNKKFTKRAWPFESEREYDDSTTVLRYSQNFDRKVLSTKWVDLAQFADYTAIDSYSYNEDGCHQIKTARQKVIYLDIAESSKIRSRNKMN